MTRHTREVRSHGMRAPPDVLKLFSGNPSIVSVNPSRMTVSFSPNASRTRVMFSSRGRYILKHLQVVIALTLRARAQPYAIQIDTSDNKLDGFFRALLNGQGSTPGKHPVVNVGSQPVPVVEVDAMAADQPKRRRRPAKAAIQPEPALREENSSRAEHRRSTRRQLALVPQEDRLETGSAGQPRQTACSTDTLPRCPESLMAWSVNGQSDNTRGMKWDGEVNSRPLYHPRWDRYASESA